MSHTHQPTAGSNESAPLLLPAPRTPSPKEAPALNRGVVAPGGIAGHFVEALQAYNRQRVVAVGSRDAERARTFADRYGIPAAYGNYEELLADDDVDIVYIASPHSGHHDQALQAIEAGRHVLRQRTASCSPSLITVAATGRGCRFETFVRLRGAFPVVTSLASDSDVHQTSTRLDVQGIEGELWFDRFVMA
ncbi:Gfo/Idh/MocA family protein [Streptomyces sp. DSM 116496]|uniref:Gfo/Idh/MocA family protein n=1 Tax=Streptomyces stoeckheimensis TaxID=3344656 RepID=UPI0038B3DCEC